MKGERRHELKEDELSAAVTHGIDWLKGNFRPVAIGVTLAIVVGLFIGWYVVNVRSAGNEAWLRLSQADQDMSALRLSTFRPDADKKMLKEARKELIERYREIARALPGTEAAVLATLQAGNLLFEHGNYTEAIEQFQAVRNQTKDGLLAQLATRSIGYALEEKGQWDEAAKEFAHAAGLGGDAMAAQSKLDEGRCLKGGGDLKGAKEALKRAVALAPESEAAAEAQQELGRLECAATPAEKAPETGEKPAVQPKVPTSPPTKAGQEKPADK
ncbi:MAG: tetratricopeptide repeat protein [Planctomycetota bacterium]